MSDSKMINRYEIQKVNGKYRVLDRLIDDFVSTYLQSDRREVVEAVMGEDMQEKIHKPEYLNL